MNGVQASLNEGANINYKVNTHIHIKHSFCNVTCNKIKCIKHSRIPGNFASLMFCVKGNLKFCEIFLQMTKIHWKKGVA